MQILNVTHFFSGHGGGIEIVADHLCKEFKSLGYKAAWAACDSGRLPADADLEIIPLRCINPIERVIGLPLLLPLPSAVKALWSAVRRADAVIVHDALYATSVIAILAAARAQKPTLLIQHIGDIPLRNKLIRGVVLLANKVVTRLMLRSADQVAFISEITRQAFSDAHMKRPPLMLFNGVDREIFYPGIGAELGCRRALGLPLDKTLCLFVGRFVEKKGLSILSELARLRPDLHFAFAGKGPLDPEKWGLHNISIFRDFFGASLAALYRSADMLLLPSVGEGYPLVVQEAMACGLPVICATETARADPAAAKWLDGVDVSLADPGRSAVEMSRHIDALNMSVTDRKDMAEYALRCYRWDFMASRVVAALWNLNERRAWTVDPTAHI